LTQQDHVESKAEEKSGGTPIRAKAGPDVTSQARAVLSLQNTAGNRATARLLAAPAKKAPLQRTPLSGLSVQRDELADAIASEWGSDTAVPYQSLAKMFVNSFRAMGKEPVEEPEKRSDTGKAGDETAGTETRANEVAKTKEPKTTLTKDQLKRKVREKRRQVKESEKRFLEGPSKRERELESLELREQRADLRLRQKALTAGKSPDKLALDEREEQLKAREDERDLADKLKKEERTLRGPQTELGRANQAKRAELDKLKEEDKQRKKEQADRLQKQKKLDALKRKLSGQLTPQEQADQDLQDQLDDLEQKQKDADKMRKFERERTPLNPEGKSLTKLMAGKRYWRG
jgi:hypothetical protein